MSNRLTDRNNSNQILDSNISSGKDTHIGDKIFVHYNLNIFLLVFFSICLIAFSLIFFISNRPFSQNSTKPGPTQFEAIAGNLEPDEIVDSTLALAEEALTPKKVSLETKEKPNPPAVVAINEPQETAFHSSKDEQRLSYFDQTVKADIALATNDDNKNIANGLKQLFKGANLKITSSFFRKKFIEEFESKVLEEDFSIFKNWDVPEYINCFCFVQQTISYHENSIEGSSFQTATGNFDIRIFDFHAQTTVAFSFTVNGAGGSQQRALESVEEKFLQIFKQKNNFNLTLCKN